MPNIFVSDQGVIDFYNQEMLYSTAKLSWKRLSKSTKRYWRKKYKQYLVELLGEIK